MSPKPGFARRFDALIGTTGVRVSDFVQADVSTTGFCTGACIDWFRKVLPLEDQSSAKDRHAVTEAKPSRVDRMKAVQSIHVMASNLVQKDAYEKSDRLTGAVETEMEAALRKQEADFRQKTDPMGLTLTLLPTGLFVVSGDKLQPAQCKALGDRMTELRLGLKSEFAAKREAASKEAYLQRDRWNDASDKRERGQLLPTAWSALGAELAGQDATKKRRFAAIVPVAGDAVSRYNSLDDYLGSAFGGPDFRAGRGVLLKIDITGTAGHSIAIHWERLNRWFLFDPNIGVYRFSTRVQILSVLLLMLEEFYVNLGSGHYWHAFALTSQSPQPVVAQIDPQVRVDISNARSLWPQ